VLLLLGGLAAAVLLVITRQTSQGPEGVATPAAVAPAVASPAASPVAAPSLAASPTPSVAVASPAAASPAPQPAASPSPAAARPAITPTPRVSPAIVPTLPALVTPPGLRFPTNTPARLEAATRTPLPPRTPPPIPTLRPPSATTPIRADRISYRVGDEATICAQASAGSSAEIQVLAPDGTLRTLTEFKPPADRVCHTMRIDLPGLYVATLTLKDDGGRELERNATVLTVTR
jgi:hypothetical protein